VLLPVRRLPSKQKRGSKYRIRVQLGEVCNPIVQALEGKACMMESEVSRLGRLRDPGQMGSRKREDAVHNEWMGRSDAQEPGSVSDAFGMVAWGNERTLASCRSTVSISMSCF
jgi:hypothetical protein